MRRVQREMVKRRMLAATQEGHGRHHQPDALRRRARVPPRTAWRAPVVVAKGQDLMAQRIKAIAREHGVPIVENVPLARALYAEAEVGDAIPGALFEAVAEVLAYLIRIKQLVL